MFVSFWRAIKYAFKDFGRNIWLSFITVSIVGLALFSFNILVGLNFLSNQAIKMVQDKIDVSVYFKQEATDSQISDLRANLEALPNVKNVTYISKDDALAAFKEKHKDDDQILKSLDELKDNPLGASLVVTANDPSDYPSILEVIQRPRYSDIIQDKNFDEHKDIIARLTTVSSRIKEIGLAVSLIFAIIAILVVFNTIRVIIYTHKEEIGMMKLVGATNGFIRMPYLIQGLLFSVLGLGLILVVWYPIMHLAQPYLVDFFGNPDINIVSYFNGNFVPIYGLQLAGVAMLNIFGSWFAVSRHLKV